MNNLYAGEGPVCVKWSTNTGNLHCNADGSRYQLKGFIEND